MSLAIPMNAEWQGIVHALESWLLLMGFVSSALLGVFAGFLYWVENRARVARLITTLEARFTDTWPLPIVVRLSEVAQRPEDLLGYLVSHIQSLGLRHSRSELEQLVKQAAFRLLLDGLDETGSRLRYLEVQRLISNFAGKHPRIESS